MAIREIVNQDNEILRKIADPITESDRVDISLENLIYDMVQTVKSVDGAGLAAPQIGVSKRVIVVKDINKEGSFFEMINPEITWTSFDKQYEFEGCLSVLGNDGKPIHERVERYKRIRVKWEDIDGNLYEELIRDPLTSRIIQHETDHLNGKLFIDYLKK
jgi:peptide deformylase